MITTSTTMSNICNNLFLTNVAQMRFIIFLAVSSCSLIPLTYKAVRTRVVLRILFGLHFCAVLQFVHVVHPGFAMCWYRSQVHLTQLSASFWCPRLDCPVVVSLSAFGFVDPARCSTIWLALMDWLISLIFVITFTPRTISRSEPPNRLMRSPFSDKFCKSFLRFFKSVL